MQNREILCFFVCSFCKSKAVGGLEALQQWVVLARIQKDTAIITLSSPKICDGMGKIM